MCALDSVIFVGGQYSMQVTYNMSFTTTYYAVSILADWLIDCVTPSISPICSVSFFGIAIYILPCVFPF